MENNETINTKPSLKGLWLLVVMSLIYILVPSFVIAILLRTTTIDDTLATIIGSSSVAVIFFFMFFNMLKEDYKKYINTKDSFKTSLKYWLKGFGLMYISNLILVLFVFKGKIATNEELNREILSKVPLIGFLEVSLVAPFVEELIFRFGLRKFIGKNKYFPIITALVFGGLHAVTGITSWMDLLYTIPYGALGYVFGLSYNETDNIFTSMVSHSVHNTVSFILIMLFS